jgi:hypothetical protein
MGFRQNSSAAYEALNYSVDFTRQARAFPSVLGKGRPFASFGFCAFLDAGIMSKVAR